MPEARASPSVRARLVVALLMGVWAVLLMLGFGAVTHRATDFDVVWHGARLFLDGQDPWLLIGPGRRVAWPSPLYYPAPALLALAPLAALPLDVARALFVGGAAALLAWAVTREAWWRLLVFVSVPFYHAAVSGQWSVLVAAAFFLWPLGLLAVLKPTVGLATVAASLSFRAYLVAAVAGVVLLAASFALAPDWLTAWRAATAQAPHMSAPVAHWRVGGPLVLLALLRWRRPEARWLVALACVPQSTVPYEAVYHMVMPASRVAALAMTVLSYAAGYAHYRIVQVATSTQQLQYLAGDALVLFYYLPTLVLVLRRPNEGSVPRWPSRLRRARDAAPIA
ncbi:hypothetical protein [Roseisolibacter agri]|uniref:Uncharacterized protein n=1 Tax=Roseisolibacter agri TaxID=2014610 RepID=A0AA37Q8J0_9BACT|nr:hypothetical protein [Roseisolibacter agri]GLC26662.1 hypothetical protein rosag_31750 [Roseisolibacter agri]